MTQSKQCPKCGGAMSDGYIIDKTYGAVGVANWVEGEPKKSFWTGLKLAGKPKLEITTWRCQRCGFLESYASAG